MSPQDNTAASYNARKQAAHDFAERQADRQARQDAAFTHGLHHDLMVVGGYIGCLILGLLICWLRTTP